jgi:hypothetical protein
VITVGLDPDEEPPVGWTTRQTLAVEPWQLAALAGAPGWSAGVGKEAPPPPVLVDRLDEVITPMMSSTTAPLAPARAAAELAVLVGADGLVAADAGLTGLWVARASRARPGTVAIPARAVRGFAVAAAIVAALDKRPAVAVTTSPFDPVTRSLVELAARVGSRITVIEWGADVHWSDAAAHRVALDQATAATGVAHVPVPVDLPATRALIEVAGAVTAWRETEAEGFWPFAGEAGDGAEA